MGSGDSDNPGGFYKEPLSPSGKGDKKLAYLLARVFEQEGGSEINTALRRSFGGLKHRLKSVAMVGDDLASVEDRIGTSTEVLRRAWKAYLKAEESCEESMSFQGSAWMDCPDPIRKERATIVDDAKRLPEQIERLLFESPWQPEIASVQFCGELVDDLKRRVEALASALRAERTDAGARIAPLKQGRPIAGLSDYSRRDLEAYAMRIALVPTRDDRILELYRSPDERLGNPQQHELVLHRAHSAINRVKKWLRSPEPEGVSIRRQIKPIASPLEPERKREAMRTKMTGIVTDHDWAETDMRDRHRDALYPPEPKETFGLVEAFAFVRNQASASREAIDSRYCFDPQLAMLSMPSEEQKVVAVLYRAFLNGEVPTGDLTAAGAAPRVIEALHTLTERPLESAEERASRVRGNGLAREVMATILRHNVAAARDDPREQGRAEAWERALRLLDKD